ncbi:18.3 kDa class I heat shock protein [Acorus calamus]|uniref:18.3 kDa class I heat shock protein n=1 Tax=Acorus calamus TaxID=4465 RepID=A0AAV9CFK5_ACOCL|nr:18.3 kDa class I heat shock protein [Acorus calamus]
MDHRQMAADRRVSRIADHISPATDDSLTSHPHHLLPMNCSSSLNSVIPRYDNKVLFARQGSTSQAYFMRQVSHKQNDDQDFSPPQDTNLKYSTFVSKNVAHEHSGMPLFSRPAKIGFHLPNPTYHSTVKQECQKSSENESPKFARPSTGSSEKKQCPWVAMKQHSSLNGIHLFSRPVQMGFHLPNPTDQSTENRECQKSSIDKSPKFGRPSTGSNEKKQHQLVGMNQNSSPNGLEWSPRMDVAESGCNYIVTIELPGVSIVDIRVEVDDKNLIVTGQRSIQLWKVKNNSEKPYPTFHRREILQGPYQVIWPLPKNVNKDGVSAEFVYGFLQIILPKH